jgi:hypothetical protein
LRALRRGTQARLQSLLLVFQGTQDIERALMQTTYDLVDFFTLLLGVFVLGFIAGVLVAV